MTKTKMDPASLAEGLKRLQASYPSVPPLDEMNVAAYAEGLAEYRGDDFIEATKRLVKVCKFFPSIADVCETMGNVMRDRYNREEVIRQRDERTAIADSRAGRISASEGVRRMREELEQMGVLPRMPTAEFVDSSERRQMLMAQAEQLKGESEAEWDARRTKLAEQARELSR